MLKHIHLYIACALLTIVFLASCKSSQKVAAVDTSDVKETIETVVVKTREDTLRDQIDANEKQKKIVWLTLAQAEEYNSVRPKKFFVDVYTDWCGWCKVMDKKTFTDEAVIKYMNRNYYPIKFDAESKKTYRFNSQSYAPQGKYNTFAVKMMEGYMSFPTTVYIDADKSLISHVPGYWKATEFLQVLTFFAENHYKTMKFEQYKAQN